MKIINTITADHNSLFRDGLVTTLNKLPHIRVIDVAENEAELIELVSRHKPDVVVTETRLPSLDGIKVTKQIKSLSPQTEVLALTIFDDPDLLIQMLEAGAIGYLLKNSSKEDIIAAIEAVAHHKTFLADSLLCSIITHDNLNSNRRLQEVQFSPKEIAVMQCICADLSNKETAEKLKINKRTVEAIRLRIGYKLGVKGTAGIVKYALKNNLAF